MQEEPSLNEVALPLTDDQVVECWKKTIDVQMHFNDIELRIRNIALTLITAIVGAAALLADRGLTAVLGGLSVPLSTIVVVAGMAAWVAFYVMDRFWYHMLLVGAVRHGQQLEARNHIVLGLTTAIGNASPLTFGRVTLRSKHKLDLFYGVVFFLLLLVAIGFSVISIKPLQQTPQPAVTIHLGPISETI